MTIDFLKAMVIKDNRFFKGNGYKWLKICLQRIFGPSCYFRLQSINSNLCFSPPDHLELYILCNI